MKYFSNPIRLQLITGFALNTIVVVCLFLNTYDVGISGGLVANIIIYSLMGNVSWYLLITESYLKGGGKIYLNRMVIYFMYAVSLFFLFNVMSTPSSEMYKGEGIFRGGGHVLILILMNLIQIIPPIFFKFIIKSAGTFFRV